MEEIRVHVVRYRDRKNLVMRYRCPLTGRQVSRSAGTPRQKEADKRAAVWEDDLRAGRYQPSSRMAWPEFREFYESTGLATRRDSTAANYASTLNAFEQTCRPERLADLTTARVTAFSRSLRVDRRLAAASVGRHLRQLKAIARWAKAQGLLTALPSFEIPTGAKRMKGRPITGEEFDRMLESVEGVVGEQAAASWRTLLRGLWWSGLRLGEALALRWDHAPGGVSVALSGRRSVLRFDGAAQKNGKLQVVPLAPEAVELLETIRRDRGWVFRLDGRDGRPASRETLAAGRRISAIGKAAGVVTDPATDKTATAHDLRRSFGHRWSRRVMPATLKELMRHASIETTMTYYVGQDAETTAAELWESLPGTNLGNTGPQQLAADPPETAEALQSQGF